MQKKIAIINDISGFGRCSVTVALPILSAMGISCGVVPTAILSNHTEYPDYSMLDFTPYMEDYISKWKQLELQFDAIYTGFLGSAKQIAIIKQMLSDFHFPHVIVDPVMGDHGIIYDSYTKEMCAQMKELVRHATIITPNVTELCVLTDHTYCDNLTDIQIQNMCTQIAKTGPKQIVVTGIETEDKIGNAIYDDGDFEIQYTKKILPLRPGTGDVFASMIAGYSLHNTNLSQATKKASRFIATCLETSKEFNIPINDGVCFEEHLSLLFQKNK
ncbi:MAG: pyridoxamine kinase [Eubacteriales bacterium]|nr:pyridoxamine kinase [Eubacteriales bacterium]